MENPVNHTSVKIIRDEKLTKYIRKATFQCQHALETEEGDLPFYEILLAKKTIKDSFPMHIGNAVLQHSKLHFIRYDQKLKLKKK